MAIFRVILRGLFWVLMLYWLTFIGYTLTNLATGGSSAAVLWFRHISGAVFQWNWWTFLIQQIIILAITLASWFYGSRPSDHAVSQS